MKVRVSQVIVMELMLGVGFDHQTDGLETGIWLV